jgi:hypothetical protein
MSDAQSHEPADVSVVERLSGLRVLAVTETPAEVIIEADGIDGTE